MDFRDDVNLDSSQVEDVGGRGGGGGGGFPGGMVVGGGGVLTLIVMVAVFVINSLGGGGEGQPAQQQPSSNLSQECKTGKDADQSEKCRVVGVVNSIQDYWKTEVSGYRAAKTILYSGGVRTACGAADSSVGPFYCPGDQRVYLDLSFFDDLQSRFGAKGGPFAQAYVIAHEYGHHVQNLLGALEGGGSVATELQADCYAGVWANKAIDTGFYDKPFTGAEIAEALDAAAAVGDDRIQERTQGRVDPDSFTHGSSEQRVKAFQQGYKTGQPARCGTADLR
ncbi:KPN_02809 family neutral zinc metallopeptidase [Nonomuraea cavernae]|uniref:Membrane protein n=1 Tax=Nonomuraea cavernae TaxID=2045107 RepID=A0A917YS24_9ACTN|nr:neutral zinc metallopeptidase [Nonomuraea cavernae]MCA2184055.1 neutral zinc metallopeptidase [Nonomuraea cavernae]GGO62182.1 membrane protein [Nonomuraea cavernae]